MQRRRSKIIRLLYLPGRVTSNGEAMVEREEVKSGREGKRNGLMEGWREGRREREREEKREREKEGVRREEIKREGEMC